MSSNIKDELKSEARGYTSWSVENAVDFPDKILPQCDVILDSESGEVLTAGGILQLTGAGKIGKTMLLLNILFGLAIGRYVLGFRISKPRRVLYLNGENSSRTMQSRLKLLRDYFCIDDEQADLLRKNLLIVNGGFSIQQPDVLKDIRGNLKEIRPGVLVIDPLKNFYSGEENSADDMRKFMVAVRELIREFNLTVIIIHHTGKKQNDNNFYSGRGSSLLADDAETTVSFQKDANNKGLFNLFVTGRNCDEFTLHLTKQPERWYLYSLTDKPEPLPDHTLIEILEQLPCQFRTGAFEDTAHTKGIKRSTCFEKLKTLENGGIIKRVAHGLYEKVNPEVSPEVQIPIGAGQVDFEKQLKRVSPEVQNSPDRTIQIIEPADDYKGLF
ncbi:MAG: AAA family ATPase [Chlorobiaceae bacterium]|nr:AAA family ATPase [Chlorobiaceae bacterium]